MAAPVSSRNRRRTVFTRKVQLVEQEKIVFVGVTDIFFYTKIRDAYKPAGYALKRITSPDEILAKAKTHAPTAIVLNMNDPGLDAATMLKTAKDETALHHVPVLAFANHEEVDTWRRAKELGIDKIVSRNEFSARTLALLEEVTQHRPA